jgi:histidine ammonia-lyase
MSGVEPATLTAPIQSFMQSIAGHSAFLDEDRPLEHELRRMTQLIRQGHWELYSNV